MNSRRDPLTASAQPETSAPQNVTQHAVTESASRGGLEAKIAQRAYERYETRGREPGHDQDDWFQAEREVLGEDPRASADTPRMT